MNKNWSDEAWSDYLYWQSQDRKTLKKINDLLKDIERNGEHTGIGHPEPLRGNLSDLWSRRIDEKNRLVYKVVDDTIVLICREHYGQQG